MPASNIAPPADMVVAAVSTGRVGSETRARDFVSHADLVVEVAWLAAAVVVHTRQHEAMLDQLRAEHADALAKSVESQWRVRDAARVEAARLNGALAEARAEIERLTAAVAQYEAQVAMLNTSLARARARPPPPHRAENSTALVKRPDADKRERTLGGPSPAAQPSGGAKHLEADPL